MSNEQLAVLLLGYLERFHNAADECWSMMPETMRQKTQNLFSEPIETIPELEPLYQLINSMRDEISIVTGKKGY